MEMNSNYSLYKHTFPNGKVYIGITSQPLEKRFENGRGYKQCPKMHNAILKYGWNNVEHELLMTGLTKPQAEQAEIETIAFYNSVENGYNTDHGGNCAGTHSIETRKKISDGNKGKKKPATEARKKMLSEMNKGAKNPFFGKHHSEEVKNAHSDFMKGNQYNKGNHHTAEFKAQKSEQMKILYSGGGNPKCKKVFKVDEKGITEVFFSLREAARQMNKSVATLHKHVNNNDFYDGYYWGYVT